MRELRWNEHDIVECLGVVGKFDETSGVHSFKVRRNEWTLDLGIGAYDRYVSVFLLTEQGMPVFETGFYIFGDIVYVNESKAAFLDFRDCVFTEYFGGWEALSEKLPPFLSGLQIHMFPDFKVRVS